MDSASKTLAEKAAWRFVEEEKPSFDIATINPRSFSASMSLAESVADQQVRSTAMVFGSVLQEVDKPENLNTSVASFYAVLAGEKTEADLPGGSVLPFSLRLPALEV